MTSRRSLAGMGLMALMPVMPLMPLLPAVHAAPSLYTPTTTYMTTPTATPSDAAFSPVTSHGTFTGPSPTTTGAESTSVLASSISALPPGPDASSYPADGALHADQPAPYTPAGGIGTNGSEPVYRVQSDFDYQSLALALYQEWIELDLFNWALATFSPDDFDANNITADDRSLIAFMANQEIGHATVLSNMLGPEAPRQCTYNYPATNVREWIDFTQKLTRWGESGVYGFLPHLNSGPAAQLLLQSIAVEARQQLVLRQLGGQFPMPFWHAPGIPQSWAWTFLAPFISSCPANQTRLVWQNFPALQILNQPNPARINASSAFNETIGNSSNTLTTQGIPPNELCNNSAVAGPLGVDCSPAITHNRSLPLSYPGRQIFLHWDAPGLAVGPNNSYVTSTGVTAAPRYAAFVSQLNVTYSPLYNVSTSMRTAYTIQPNVSTFAGDPAVNGTMFLALTDDNIFVTPYNLSQINPHVAALAIYQAG